MAGDSEQVERKRFGRRCAIGCESWPDLEEYERCPICGEVTTRYNNLLPLTKKEAKSRAAHARFEDFYEERCAARGVTVNGPIRNLSDIAAEKRVSVPVN